MHRSDLRRAATSPNAEPTAVEQAARAAFQILLDTVHEGQRNRSIAREDPRRLALACWASVHGLSVLIIDGLAPPVGAEALARTVTGVLGAGLRPRGGKRTKVG